MNYCIIIVSQMSLYLDYICIASYEAWAYEADCNKHLNKIIKIQSLRILKMTYIAIQRRR